MIAAKFCLCPNSLGPDSSFLSLSSPASSFPLSIYRSCLICLVLKFNFHVYIGYVSGNTTTGNLKVDLNVQADALEDDNDEEDDIDWEEG